MLAFLKNLYSCVLCFLTCILSHRSSVGQTLQLLFFSRHHIYSVAARSGVVQHYDTLSDCRDRLEMHGDFEHCSVTPILQIVGVFNSRDSREYAALCL